MKIDDRDLGILGVLAQNCRISHTAIGHAVRLSKDAVAYRIARLEEAGVLKQFMLLIDARALGFTRYHLLLQFDCGSEQQQKFVAAMALHPFVMWINTFVGRYDAQVIVDARDGLHLNEIRNELFAACKQQIKHYSVLTHLFDYEFTNLIPAIDLKLKFDRDEDGSFGTTATCRNYPVDPKVRPYRFDSLDLEILEHLADDPRCAISELSRRIPASRGTVRKRIEDLITSGVIRSFGAITDVKAFGRVTYYLLVRVAQNAKLSSLRKPFGKLNNVFYSGSMLGDYDMILYLNASSPQELNASIDLFRVSLEPHLLHYDLLVQEGVHYWRHFTRGIKEYAGKSLVRES